MYVTKGFAGRCRLVWTDLDGRCLAKLIVKASHVLNFDYKPCASLLQMTHGIKHCIHS